MDDLSNFGGWREAVTEEFTVLATKTAAVLPQFLAAALILLAGGAISWMAAGIARRALRALGVDRLAHRHRLAERAGLTIPVSTALGRVVFWILMTTFLLSSIEVLGLGGVTAAIDRLVAFVPSLVGAALIALLGILTARFAGSVTGSAAAAAGFSGAHRLGFLVQALGVTLVVIVTFEQLGVATEILVGPLTVALATAGLTAGLAFALGARPVITHILAGHFLKQSLPRDAFVEVNGERGIVERVGPTDTLLANGEKRWSVPNAQLLEVVVVRTAARP
jgi:hypothetical protein